MVITLYKRLFLVKVIYLKLVLCLEQKEKIKTVFIFFKKNF